jgi:tetratricopeptide (TPR) repeat protein
MKIRLGFLITILFIAASVLAQAPARSTPTGGVPSGQSNSQAPNAQAPSEQTPASQAPAASVTGPMTEKEVISELKKQGADQLVKDVGQRGVAFEMDPDIEKRLRKAKATDQVIQAVTQAGPKERAAAAKAAAMAAGEALLSPQESADFKTLQSELDPDKAIALAEAFAQKYPKSEVLSYAYAIEANAYQMKGNAEKIVEYGQKSLDLKKDNLMALLIVAYAMPSPQYFNQHQGDAEKILTKADGYCQDALKAIDELKKQPNESDADFAKRKASYASNIHADLGMIHLDRAQLGLMGLDQQELAKAEQEYRTAVTTTDKPEANDYYRLGETCKLENKVNDAIAAFSKAADLAPAQSVVKQYAERQVDSLKKSAPGGAPAKP